VSLEVTYTDVQTAETDRERLARVNESDYAEVFGIGQLQVVQPPVVSESVGAGDPPKGSSMPSGAVVGGVSVVLIIAAVACWYCFCKKRKSSKTAKQTSTETRLQKRASEVLRDEQDEEAAGQEPRSTVPRSGSLSKAIAERLAEHRAQVGTMAPTRPKAKDKYSEVEVAMPVTSAAPRPPPGPPPPDDDPPSTRPQGAAPKPPAAAVKPTPPGRPRTAKPSAGPKLAPNQA